MRPSRSIPSGSSTSTCHLGHGSGNEAGVGIRLYYTLWQLLLAREARRLCREERFDVVHHLTFANVWLPALACLAGPPFVLGPVAGGQRVPLLLYPALGLRGVTTELLLSLRALNRLNPLVRLGWSRSSLILVNNLETMQALPRRHRAKVRVRPNACAAVDPGLRRPPRNLPSPRASAVSTDSKASPWRSARSCSHPSGSCS